MWGKTTSVRTAPVCRRAGLAWGSVCASSVARAEHQGSEHFLCSDKCFEESKTETDADPTRYLTSANPR